MTRPYEEARFEYGPRKVRWFEIVTGYCVGMAAIVLLSLIWTRFA